MRKSPDGFPFKKAVVIPDTPRLNMWSRWGTTKLVVADYWLNARDIVWRGATTHVADYELFVMYIKDVMIRYNWTKEKALDDFFEMGV